MIYGIKTLNLQPLKNKSTMRKIIYLLFMIPVIGYAQTKPMASLTDTTITSDLNNSHLKYIKIALKSGPYTSIR